MSIINTLIITKWYLDKYKSFLHVLKLTNTFLQLYPQKKKYNISLFKNKI